MTVYLITDQYSGKVFAVFSSEEKASAWLEHRAEKCGWTPEVVHFVRRFTRIEPCPVDPE